MNTKVETFLNSDLLERYLLGHTTSEESLQVAHFIETYPEVAKEYIELQENLEHYATSFAVQPPKKLKGKVMRAVRQSGGQSASRTPVLAIVACSVAVIFGFISFMFWKQNNALLEDRQITNNLIERLNDDIVSNKESLTSVEEQFRILNNAETKKYVLRGNNRARKLQTVAYVNQLEKKSYVNVVALPELPDDQVYQMWADVDGKLVPLDILKVTKNNLVEIPYEERMASLNITIEPKGGSKEATKDNIVANINFQ